MEKIDFKKELKHFYRPSSKKVETIVMDKMNYLMVDGEGGPGSQSFQDAIDVLFPLSYTLKFMVKKGDIGIDYGVLPLEGLWWSDDMASFKNNDKEAWKWTLMVMQPDFVTTKMVHEALDQVRLKKNPASLSLVRFESLSEGKIAQIMHIGPFSEEGPTVDKLHNYIAESGFHKRGKHHEIYLSDISRTAPEKWKTIIRQPMA